MCARTGLSATVAADVRDDLAPLGIDVVVQTYTSSGAFFADVGNPAGPCDLSDVGLSLQMADAVHWLRTSFRSGMGAFPTVRYTSAALDQQFDDALPLSGAARDAAAADLDAALSDAAVLVPYASRLHGEFFSARIGCQSNHPLYGVNLNRPLRPRSADVVDPGGSVSTGGDASADAPLQTSVTSTERGRGERDAGRHDGGSGQLRVRRPARAAARDRGARRAGLRPSRSCSPSSSTTNYWTRTG